MGWGIWSLAQNLSVQEPVVAPRVHDLVLGKLTAMGRFSGTWNTSDFLGDCKHSTQRLDRGFSCISETEPSCLTKAFSRGQNPKHPFPVSLGSQGTQGPLSLLPPGSSQRNGGFPGIPACLWFLSQSCKNVFFIECYSNHKTFKLFKYFPLYHRHLRLWDINK